MVELRVKPRPAGPSSLGCLAPQKEIQNRPTEGEEGGVGPRAERNPLFKGVQNSPTQATYPVELPKDRG